MGSLLCRDDNLPTATFFFLLPNATATENSLIFLHCLLRLRLKTSSKMLRTVGKNAQCTPPAALCHLFIFGYEKASLFILVTSSIWISQSTRILITSIQFKWFSSSSSGVKYLRSWSDNMIHFIIIKVVINTRARCRLTQIF